MGGAYFNLGRVWLSHEVAVATSSEMSSLVPSKWPGSRSPDSSRM